MNEETRIQRKIMVGLSDYGMCFRINVGLFFTQYGAKIKIGVDGFSDLLFIGDLKVFKTPTVAFLEVKTATGRPTKEQLNFIAKMTESGHIAGVVRGLEDAKRLLGVI